MRKSFKRYIVLSLVLLLALLPLMMALSQVKELQGGIAGLIVLGIFIVLSIIYWIVMIILTKKGSNK